jgi:hypothetical protein
LPERRRGGLGRPESNNKDLSASGCDASGDLVEGRVRNLAGFNPRSTLNNLRQDLYDFTICSATVGFRNLFQILDAEADRFPLTGSNQDDLVLETLQASHHRNDFFLNDASEFLDTIGL